jgi:hypothetical protein
MHTGCAQFRVYNLPSSLSPFLHHSISLSPPSPPSSAHITTSQHVPPITQRPVSHHYSPLTPHPSPALSDTQRPTMAEPEEGESHRGCANNRPSFPRRTGSAHASQTLVALAPPVRLAPDRRRPSLGQLGRHHSHHGRHHREPARLRQRHLVYCGFSWLDHHRCPLVDSTHARKERKQRWDQESNWANSRAAVCRLLSL